jgi:hypothetical protein
MVVQITLKGYEVQRRTEGFILIRHIGQKSQGLLRKWSHFERSLRNGANQKFPSCFPSHEVKDGGHDCLNADTYLFKLRLDIM